METEAQKKASKKWNSENKEHRNYLSNRSAARSFIRKKATLEDLEELKEILDNKIEELKKGE